LKNHRKLIEAELALNEGGGGAMDKTGKPIRHGIQAGEKIFQTFQLEVTNSGGHSSVPIKDNAIYRLSDALSRLGKFDFPFRLTPVTRGFFETMSNIETGQLAADMKGILREPVDTDALNRLSATTPFFNASLRTTCVATMVNAGHATNALPQRAQASVNCRILPGETVEQTQIMLSTVFADSEIKITPMGTATVSPAQPLHPELMKAVTELTNQMWPGIPVVPTMSPGGTDGRFLNNAGIWTYGVSGIFSYPEGSNAHGLNEHLPVKSLYEGQAFLYALAKKLAQ
jgi:acetylornithine deacetylase/succinyl-diaminopimelate desuccinylase-like protein